MTFPHSDASDTREVAADGRGLVLTNLDKVLWPEVGFTKRQMISYYASIAPVLLPHLRARPLTLKRYPDGVEGLYWFQTECRGRPSWMRTHRISNFDYCIVDDLAALLWVANLASIELHPLLWVAEGPPTPSAVVFDLDPGPPAGLVACCRVALRVRSYLAVLGLESCAKTSGLEGLHVFVPLNGTAGFEATRSFARDIARTLAEEDRNVVIDRADRRLRSGKVFVDWAQNNAMRSMVAPYSLRAAAVPRPSMPVTWDEVEEAVATSRTSHLEVVAGELIDRVEALGDLFGPVLELRQDLPDAE